MILLSTLKPVIKFYAIRSITAIFGDIQAPMTPLTCKNRQWQQINPGAGRNCASKCARGKLLNADKNLFIKKQNKL